MIHSLNKLEIKTDLPWLILGKGPSFSRIGSIDLTSFYTLGLNETVNFVECSLAHFIDIEVAKNINLKNKHSLFIVPFHPHLKNRPTTENLDQHKERLSFLRMLNFEERLFTYNLSTYKGHILHKGTPYIKAKYFSVEAAFRILANAGVRVIYTLGIDGGTSYADCFLERGYIPLTNGRKSFDDQFIELHSIVNNMKLSWIKL